MMMEYTEKMAITLTPRQRRAVERLAAQERCTLSEMMRRLLDEAMVARGAAEYTALATARTLDDELRNK